MNVHGYEIPREVEKACEDRMLSGEQFDALAIEHLARLHGVPMSRANNPVAYRYADRLIQRERKAGRIVRVGKSWVAAE